MNGPALRGSNVRAVCTENLSFPKILDLSQRQWIADIHHHREADDLGRTVEITEGIAHRRRLGMPPARLKPIYSDNAVFIPRISTLFRVATPGCALYQRAQFLAGAAPQCS
jgi:hypothetical protein